MFSSETCCGCVRSHSPRTSALLEDNRALSGGAECCTRSTSQGFKPEVKINFSYYTSLTCSSPSAHSAICEVLNHRSLLQDICQSPTAQCHLHYRKYYKFSLSSKGIDSCCIHQACLVLSISLVTFDSLVTSHLLMNTHAKNIREGSHVTPLITISLQFY